MNNLRPKVVGGVRPNAIWGKQYHQQDRIYDADEIALCITSVSIPWYKVKSNEQDDGGN